MPDYTTHLRMAKVSQGDDDWANEDRPVRDQLDFALAPQNVFSVAKNYTPANLFPAGNPTSPNRRHFEFIQAAILENEANGGGGVIEVAPGDYDQQLVIQKSVTIIGRGLNPNFYAGAPVKVRGSGSLAPTVLIIPEDATTMQVNLVGLSFENSYQASNGTEITSAPYWLQVQDKQTFESWGPSINTLTVSGCSVRMQTWGPNNKWEAGLKAKGWWGINFVRSQISGLGYGGGNDNGFVRRLFDVEGSSASFRVLLKIINSHLASAYGASASPAPTLRGVYQRSQSQALMARTHATMPSNEVIEQSGTGITAIGFPGATWDDVWAVNKFGGPDTVHN